jgi:hypothetical protein
MVMDKYIFIKKTIDEWDPIGLLEMGCPDDEYEPEIREIERLAYHAKSIDELALGIRQVLIKWFDEYFPIEKCYPVALKIWTEYQEKN